MIHRLRAATDHIRGVHLAGLVGPVRRQYQCVIAEPGRQTKALLLKGRLEEHPESNCL